MGIITAMECPLLADLLLLPFQIDLEYYDYHVMLYIKGHPEYEAIEAMVKITGKGNPLIRVTLTLHDQNQIDLYNCKTKVTHLMNSGTGRLIYHVPIQFKHKQLYHKEYIQLKFCSHKGEDILFEFHALSKTQERYGGLTNPGKHSINTSLPVMYRTKSTLAGSKSSITIDGVKYQIPLKFWIPFVFKAMQGYYSEGFLMAALRSAKQVLQAVKSPAGFLPGEKWIYQHHGIQEVYEIVSVKGAAAAIKGTNKVLLVEGDHHSLKLKKILFYHDTANTPSALFAIAFKPALPIKSSSGDIQAHAAFQLLFNGQTILISGIAKVASDRDSTRILLQPENPSWAKKRKVYTAFTLQDGQYELVTEIGI